MPKISIIIPVYNVEKYLSQCLDSIINQTFKDFECICVNDGSKDNSLNILQEYSKKDNRIKIVSQENKGVSIARNVGMKISKGKYISFIDSDDWICNDYLEVLYNNMEKFDYDIVICNHYFYYSKDDKLVPVVYDIVINKETTSFDRFICGYNRGAVWARLYKREFLENNKMSFLENVVMEDYIFSIITYLSTKKVLFLNDNLYYYRKQTATIMSNYDKVTISQFYNNFYLIKELRKRKINSPAIENCFVRKFFHNLSDVYKRVKKSGQSIDILFNKSLDALYFFNTIKKDLKVKYKIAIPISIRLFLIFKKEVFCFRKLFMLIY